MPKTIFFTKKKLYEIHIDVRLCYFATQPSPNYNIYSKVSMSLNEQQIQCLKFVLQLYQMPNHWFLIKNTTFLDSRCCNVDAMRNWQRCFAIKLPPKK